MALSSAEKQRAYRERQRSKIVELTSAANVIEVGNVTEEARRIIKLYGIDQMTANQRKQIAAHLLAAWFPEFLDINFLAVLFKHLEA